MGFWEFVGKTVATVATGVVLGPAAIPVGAAVWGANKIVQETCDDEDFKKFFGTIGDIGGGAALGAVGGEIVNGLGGLAAKEMVRNSGRVTNGVKVLTNLQEAASIGSELYDGAYAVFEIRSDIEKHLYHQAQGVNYQRDCKICSS